MNTEIANTLTAFYVCGVNNLSHIPPDYDLFFALNSLNKIKVIEISAQHINVIPERSFKQRNLKRLSLSADISSNYSSIKLIENYAFYDLENLKYLNIDNQKLNFLDDSSLSFDDRESTNGLEISLSYNQLNGDSFSKGTFTNSKIPLYVNLSWNNITYINQDVFMEFFLSNNNNTIINNLDGNPLDCYDCRSYWIFDHKNNIKYQIINARCMNNNWKILCDNKESEFINGNNLSECYTRTLLDENDFLRCHESVTNYNIYIIISIVVLLIIIMTFVIIYIKKPKTVKNYYTGNNIETATVSVKQNRNNEIRNQGDTDQDDLSNNLNITISNSNSTGINNDLLNSRL
jgi:hypothetical protein